MYKEMGIRRSNIMLSVLLMVGISCTYDELGTIRDTDRYDVRFMLYPGGMIAPGNEAPIVTLTFDDERNIIKKSGGLVPAPYFIGFDYLFIAGIYDELPYGNDVITIQRKEGPSNRDLPYTKYIYFKGDRILRIVVKNSGNEVIMYPHYNASGLIYKTVETTWRNVNGKLIYLTTMVKEMFYAGGNLIRIEGTLTGVFDNGATTLELFSEYDTAPNPTIGLRIFDEVFYRSLSKNNFRKYSYERRNSSGYVSEKRNRSWEFAYDNDGVPVFY
jgi:hypothetical protein